MSESNDLFFQTQSEKQARHDGIEFRFPGVHIVQPIDEEFGGIPFSTFRTATAIENEFGADANVITDMDIDFGAGGARAPQY